MSFRHAAMLEVNEFLVLDHVREHAHTSRPQIARALGLSPASVSRIVNRLLRAGLVVEGGREESDGGRPARVISFNRRAGAVMAIDLGAATCRGVLADLAGDFLHEVTRPTEGGAAFDTLVATLDAVSRQGSRAGIPVSALAVSVPAIMDPETGLGRSGPSVQWETFDIVAALEKQVSVPFVVENDVNLAALAHAWRGDARQVDDYFVLYLGAGVGGALVANGGLVRGRHHGAGEVGYMLLDRGQARVDLDGALGGMESAIATSALLGRARAIAREAGRSVDRSERYTSVERLFGDAETGDRVAIEVIAELVDRVGMILVAVGSIADPSLVILDGPVGGALEPFAPELSAILERRLPKAPRVAVSHLGGESTLVGAVAAALQLARRRAVPEVLSGALAISEARMA